VKWRTEPPLGGEHMRCLLTCKTDTGIRYVTIGWAGYGEMMRGAVAWAPLPEHIAKCPDGWMSQYRGDDSPSESGLYLVSLMKGNRPAPVQLLWYNHKKDTFGGSHDYVGWMPEPKPFNGSAGGRSNNSSINRRQLPSARVGS